MVTVKRFGVLSVGIIFGILYAVIGLIAGLFSAGIMSLMFSLASSYDSSFDSVIDMGAFGWMFGGMSIILFPVVYGIMGFVGGIIMATLYNLLAGWVGGVKVEIVEDIPVIEIANPPQA